MSKIRFSGLVLSCMLILLTMVTTGRSAILAVSNVYIEPKGYEDPSTHEWKGSFWVIVATTDTKEEYLLYQFNKSESGKFGQNKMDDKTIIPNATIKITITPRQPYWERPLKEVSYMVYPKTYGMQMNKLTNQLWNITNNYVDQLDLNVLEFSTKYWTLHTPFDVAIEKVGEKAFAKTISIDTVGGTETVIIANPADSTEKLMITDLGKLGTGYSEPAIHDIVVFRNDIIFEKTDALLNAIKYGRDLQTGETLNDNSYAFYWFGGGKKFLGHFWEFWGEVQYFDDMSPAHYFRYAHINYPVDDGDFPGSYRDDTLTDYKVLPVEAYIFDNRNDTNPTLGLSLVNYLINRTGMENIAQNLDVWEQGKEITVDNKLRIYMPKGAASSLVTIKVSTELVDSFVYQPIIGNGEIEGIFWNSTKGTKASIVDKDVAVVKVKQLSPISSKLTVTPSVPDGIAVSVNPQKDSAIIEPSDVHTFEFEVINLGVPEKKTSTITFKITNDLGNETDSGILEFDLLPGGLPPEEPPEGQTPEEGTQQEYAYGGTPLWLIPVGSIVIAAVILTVYFARSKSK